MFSKKITQLIQFPLNLVYEFQYESMHRRSTKSADKSSLEYLQYVDVLNTYLFIQEDILPQINARGIQHITATEWLDWLNAMHARISNQMALFHNFAVGAYRSSGVSWYRDGAQGRDYLATFLAGRTPLSAQQFCQRLHEIFKHPTQDYVDFLDVVKTINDQDAAHLVPSQAATALNIAPAIRSGWLMLARLHAAYLANLLTESQKNSVHKIMRIYLHAESIPDAMQEFGLYLTTVVAQLECADKVYVAKVMTDVFAKLMHIHPFFNGNGRVALCLMNTLLVASGQAAILLYRSTAQSSDKFDPTSLYTQAISKLIYDKAPFVQLITEAIDASTEGLELDVDLRARVDERVGFSETLV